MIFRIFITLMLFILAIYAFVGNALEEGHFFNPFGILFLMLTVLVWFGWRPICGAFRSAKEEAALPILPMTRLGSALIEGMRRPPQAHRDGDEPSQSG